MRRPPLHPFRAVVGPAILVASAISAALAGCAAPGPLADPREIVDRSVTAVASARSFHYLATLEGEVPLPAVGTAEAAPLDLKGTTIEGSVDVVRASGSAAMEIPGLGPAFDAVVVGPDLWLRVGILGGGYRRTTAAGSPLAILADPSTGLAAVRDAMAALPGGPRKGGDRDCGDARCYVVTFDVPPGSVGDLSGVLGGLAGAALGPGFADGLGSAGDLGGLGGFGAGGSSGIPFPSVVPSFAPGGGTAELLVRIDDLRPYSLAFRGPTDAVPSITVVLDRWDEPVRIEPPAGAG